MRQHPAPRTIAIAAAAALAWLAHACDEEVGYEDTTTADTGSEGVPDVVVDTAPEDSPDMTVDSGEDTVPEDTHGEGWEDPVGGEQTCSEVWTCLEGCAGDDTTCVMRCSENACAPSREALYNLQSCKNSHCRAHCMEDLTAELCVTCLDLNCAEQMEACQTAGC